MFPPTNASAFGHCNVTIQRYAIVVWVYKNKAPHKECEMLLKKLSNYYCLNYKVSQYIYLGCIWLACYTRPLQVCKSSFC